MKRSIIIVILGIAIAALLTIESRAEDHDNHAAHASANAAGTKHILILPDDLKWEDIPSLPPGAKAAVLEGDPTKEGFFTIRLKFPDGYKIPPHFHPIPERVTVLSGTFRLGMGDKFDKDAAKSMPVGAYTSMPKGMHHYAWSEGESTVQLSSMGPWGITYLNPSDDPRKTAK
jgi:quercetin dioxygenase-like cupin family protein